MTADEQIALGQEARDEAEALLEWWLENSPDPEDGGFYGEIDPSGVPVPKANKSVILNTRLLWFFSAMARHLKSDAALQQAERAASYISDHFLDPDNGGLYWDLDHSGKIADSKKQAYAQAFGIYGFSEYYRASGDTRARDIARQLLQQIEAHYWDRDHGGYAEALSRDWGLTGEVRLSEKETNHPKTMNTHLHILEAYSNLHAVAPDPSSESALKRALDIFSERFAGGDHLKLFFDADWTDRTQSVSFGHDVEAAWLMWEAALVLGDEDRVDRVRPQVLRLTDATLSEGWNPDGGLAYERHHSGHTDFAGEWWGQAEAMIGFVNAWELTGQRHYLDATARIWDHIKSCYRAPGNNEWTWYASNAGKPPVYKAGQWKCPYHNGRAMQELEIRLSGQKG
jgi:mannobiose 2-epimerase